MDDTLFVRLFCDELVRLKLDPKTEPRILLEGRVRLAVGRARVEAKATEETPRRRPIRFLPILPRARGFAARYRLP